MTIYVCPWVCPGCAKEICVPSQKDVDNLEVREKKYRVSMGGGIYVEVRPSGGRTFQRREGNVFKKINASDLKQARQLVKSGAGESFGGSVKFAVCAEEYFESHVRPKSRRYRQNVRSILDRHLLPALGDMYLEDITPKYIYQSLIVKTTVMAQVSRGIYSKIARYGVMMGYVDRDVSRDLTLPQHTQTQLPSVTDPNELKMLLRDIDQWTGHLPQMIALRLSPMLALRPKELREGTWDEVDFDNKLWRIPKERMKGKVEHIVPLSTQAIQLLTQLKLTGTDAMFYGLRGRFISHQSLNSALRELGWSKNKVCMHGFRRTFSTILNEHGKNRDHIEVQLAHVIPGVRGVYNQALYLEQRRDLMQYWADYLDEIKA